MIYSNLILFFSARDGGTLENVKLENVKHWMFSCRKTLGANNRCEKRCLSMLLLCLQNSPGRSISHKTQIYWNSTHICHEIYLYLYHNILQIHRNMKYVFFDYCLTCYFFYRTMNRHDLYIEYIVLKFSKTLRYAKDFHPHVWPIFGSDIGVSILVKMESCA